METTLKTKILAVVTKVALYTEMMISIALLLSLPFIAFSFCDPSQYCELVNWLGLAFALFFALTGWYWLFVENKVTEYLYKLASKYNDDL